MMNRKLLKMMLISSLAIHSLIYNPYADCKITFVSIAQAKIQSFTASGDAMCNFGENDPQINEAIKAAAKNKAIQAARGKAGVYIKNYTKTINSVVSEDSISTMQNLIVDTIDVKYSEKIPVAMGNDVGVKLVATVTVKIDTNSISDYLKKDHEKRQQLEITNKGLQQSIDENNKTFDEISKNSINAKTQVEKNKIILGLNKTQLAYSAQQKAEESFKAYYNGQTNEAIKLCNEAINMNSHFATAYALRGCFYFDSGSKKFSIPVKRDSAYNDFNNALKDFDKTIELSQNFESVRGIVYVYRSIIYGSVYNDFDKGLEEINKAIQMFPYFGNLYSVRAFYYQMMGKENEAQKDYAKAKSLGIIY